MATDDVKALTQERYENLMIPALEEENRAATPSSGPFHPPGVRPRCAARPSRGKGRTRLSSATAGPWPRADPPSEVSWGFLLGAGRPARGGFESLPVRTSALPFLEIPVAGDLGGPGPFPGTGGNRHRTRSPRSGPAHVAGQQWLERLRAGAGRGIQIVARDDSETKWFAFKGASGRWAGFSSGRCVCWPDGGVFSGRARVASFSVWPGCFTRRARPRGCDGHEPCRVIMLYPSAPDL